jgi:hypothetical protein
MKAKLIMFLVLCGLAVFASGCIVPVEEHGDYHRDWGWHREHWHD